MLRSNWKKLWIIKSFCSHFHGIKYVYKTLSCFEFFSKKIFSLPWIVTSLRWCNAQPVWHGRRSSRRPCNRWLDPVCARKQGLGLRWSSVVNFTRPSYNKFTLHYSRTMLTAFTQLIYQYAFINWTIKNNFNLSLEM